MYEVGCMDFDPLILLDTWYLIHHTSYFIHPTYDSWQQKK